MPRKKAIDCFPVNAEDAADADRIQSPVVDQPPDRLRMHAKLIRNLANADEPGFSAWCRHGRGPKPRTFFGLAHRPSELGAEVGGAMPGIKATLCLEWFQGAR